MASPDLLIIHTDEQSSWTLGSYGGNLVHTPNIDRLAREGALLQNFFTNSAVCTPSRGCFLTGRYPHCHGAYTNDVELNRDEITLAHILQTHGYKTGYAGKWHLDGPPWPGWMSPERAMGFDDCRWMFNRGHWKTVLPRRDCKPELTYDVVDGPYMTGWLTDRAIEFLQQPRTAPFFYMLSLPDPHPPFWVSEPYASMYNPAAMPVPCTFWEENLPGWAEDYKRRYCGKLFGPEMTAADSETLLQQWMAAYCGMVKCIDDNVGRILSCLSAQGLLDDTIVVFTTDHGEYLGEHGLIGKNLIYETAYRIPLLIRWPNAIAAGTTVEQFITTVDFQQTILGLMNLQASGREQGHDASPLLRSEAMPEWKDEAFIHFWDYSLAGLFTPRYELALSQDGDDVLFDRQGDTQQTVNLRHDADLEPIVAELTARVIAHQRAVAGPATTWLGER